MNRIVIIVGAQNFTSSHVQSVLDQLEENNFKLLDQQTRCLSSTEYALASSQLELAAQFDHVKQYNHDEAKHAPVMILLMQRADAYTEFAKLHSSVLDYCYGSTSAWTALRDEQHYFNTSASASSSSAAAAALERTIVMLAPHYTQEAYALLVSQLEQNHFVLIGKQARVLTPEQAEQVRKTLVVRTDDAASASTPQLDLTSDVSVLLCIEKLNAIAELQLLLGPESAREAAAIAPDSIRGRFALQQQQQQKDNKSASTTVLCCASHSEAQSTLALLFPQPFALEQTLMLVKPQALHVSDAADGLSFYSRVIEPALRANQFTVLTTQRKQLSKTQIEHLYAPRPPTHTLSESEYNAAVNLASQGESLLLVLTKAGAVKHACVLQQQLLAQAMRTSASDEKTLSLLGSSQLNLLNPLLHVSANDAQALREVHSLFGGLPLQQLPTTLADVQRAVTTTTQQHDSKAGGAKDTSLQSTLQAGLVALCRVKPLGDDAIVWLAEWLLRNNPNRPVVSHASSSQDDAVATISSKMAQVSLSGGADDDSSSTPSRAQFVWVIGASGDLIASATQQSTAQALGASLAAQWHSPQAMHISLAELLQHAVQHGSTQHGRTVQLALKQRRPVPAHIVVDLVRDAIQGHEQSLSGATSATRRYVVSDFPATLDCAFEFESRFKQSAELVVHAKDTLHSVLQRLTSDSSAAGDLKSSSGSGEQKSVTGAKPSRSKVLQQLTQAEEELQPVLEHYATFNKLITVQSNNADSSSSNADAKSKIGGAAPAASAQVLARLQQLA